MLCVRKSSTWRYTLRHTPLPQERGIGYTKVLSTLSLKGPVEGQPLILGQWQTPQQQVLPVSTRTVSRTIGLPRRGGVPQITTLKPKFTRPHRRHQLTLMLCFLRKVFVYA